MWRRELVCTSCGSTGPFYAAAKGKGGASNYCKSCTNQKQRERRATPAGRALMMWNSIIGRVGKREYYLNVELKCTREEFIAWAVPRLVLWFENNPGVSPSVDRIKSEGHYALDNLRIISRGDNTKNRKHHRSTAAPPGTAWCGKCRKYLAKELFSARASRPGGVQGHCKKCFAAYVKERRRISGKH